MAKINSSIELFDLIKEVAGKSNNWKVDGVELVVRLAFGTKQEDDITFATPTGFLKMNDDSDYDDSCDEDGDNNLLFSQMKKDDAREKFIGAKASMAAKSNGLDIDTFLSRLYNDEESPLYHGFLHEMKENVKDCILFMNGRFDLESFPPSADSMKKICAFANEHSNECLDGLIAIRGFFPPYNSNDRDPPEKSNGNEHRKVKSIIRDLIRMEVLLVLLIHPKM